MTAYDLDLMEFPEWSQWGDGESGRCRELGYCELTDEWVSRDDTCDEWEEA